MTQRVLSLLAIFMLIVSVNVFAQTAQELRIGSFFNVNMGQGQEFWYSVRTTETGILTVETSSSIDTYLEAFDSNRNPIAENDDGGEDNNAKIDIAVRPNTTYLFKLRGYSSSTTGQVRIFASIRPLPVMTALNVGSFHSATINRGEEHWYSVSANQAGLLVVETSGSIDTYMELYNENFELINSNDDGGEGNNARIEITSRRGQNYIYKVRGYNSSITGQYRVMASYRQLPPPTPLAIGSFQNGTINSGTELWYSVRSTSRGRIVVETSSGIDTFLEAYSSEYDLITTDDDGGDDLNARIVIQAEPNATYIFKLRGFSESTTGTFRIFASMEN